MIKLFFPFHVFYICFILLTTLPACQFLTHNEKKEMIVKTIQQELTYHQQATLLDLYKNFFQGRFGPGHMIDDPDAAMDYLKQEIENATQYDSVLYQEVGYEERYYRINLKLVQDGKITFQDLLTAFIESANTSEKISPETWEKEWNSILEIIEGMNLDLHDFERDKNQISENFKNGVIVGHHSPVYQETYHPHYRIVSSSYLKKLVHE